MKHSTKKHLIKLSVVIIGLILSLYATRFFGYIRNEWFSVAFFVTIAICLILIIVTYYPEYLIFRMKISDMHRDTAHHYHAMVVNMVLGFSVVIGIGLTLIWTEPGLVWRTNISRILAGLMFYFIYTMYMVFLRELSYQIANKN